MIDKSNPAGRLYELLTKTKSLRDSTHVREVWSSALGCDKGDDAEIYKRVVEVYNLYNEVETLILSTSTPNRDLLLFSHKKIEKVFFPLNLDTSWAANKKHIDDEVTTRLQFCADALAKDYSEEQLDKEDLAKLKLLVNELTTLIEKSSLNIELRIFLLEEMSKMNFAISMYKIKGAKGIKEALHATLGGVMANADELAKQKPDNEDVLKRLGELLDRVDSCVATGLKVHKVISKPIRTAIRFIATLDDTDDIDLDDSVEE